MSNTEITEHSKQKCNKDLGELNSKISEIFYIKETEHVSFENKIIGIKFNLDQKNENFNHTIIELLNLYIVPAFVLLSNQKNKDVSVRIGNRQETFIVEKYIKQDNTYIESKQLEEQRSSSGWFKKVKNVAQDLINGKEEIEFIKINKDNLNFHISSDKSTEVEITFAESEINMEGILNCISNFKGLTNNDVIKPLIKINCDHPVAESQDKLNIYSFFAKKTIGDNKANVKQQEITLCLTTTQNDVTLVSSILKNDAGPLKIKYKENEYSLLSYSLDNPFSQNLTDFLLFFNDPSYNGDTKISNLQRIEKIFSEDIKIKNSQKDSRIKIENAKYFSSSLHYKDGNLQLKKSGSEEKIYFNFEVRVKNNLDQEKSKFIYDSTIYKIASLISFFALSFNENKFSISAEVNKKNIFFIKINSYSELVPAICEELKKHAISLVKPEDYTNPKPQHVQVLDLFCNEKKVKFKLEIEAQKIAINKLKDVEDLISGISILDLCRKEFLDNISNPVRCYLSNFFYEGNNLSCEYVIAYKDLKINNHLLDENSGIQFLEDELQKNFNRISNNLKQIQKKENFSVYSIDINIDKLLSQHIDKLQEEVATEVTEEIEITKEEVKVEPQKYIKYDLDWQEECFAKIIPANDYTSLELSLKEACKFVHNRILHTCKQLLEKINTLQLGKEQKAEQDDQLYIDESIIQATLDHNISNFNKFADEKIREFKAIKSNLDEAQRSTIASIGNSTLNAAQRYKEVIEIHLFINKNANDLQKILEKNVEELKQLMLYVQMNKNDQIIGEIDKSLAEQDLSAEESKQSDHTIQQAEENDAITYNTEESQDAGLSSTENANIQENKITSKYILELFKDLSKKLYESENLNQETDSNESQDTFTLFHNLKSQITKYIDINQKQGEKELYQKIYSKIHYIYYSCPELAELEIRNIEGVTRSYLLGEKEAELKRREAELKRREAELEIRNIEGVTRSYLLGEKEAELKRREAQLEQEVNVRKIGSDIIINIVQNVISFGKKLKDKITNLKGQPQNSNMQNIPFYNQGNDSTHNYNSQQSGYSSYNTKLNSKTITQSNNSIIDSAYSKKHKSSNLQKLKAGIKDAFSEKENYAFFVFIAVGASGALAYFVPEGLRKFVPSEKLNIIDITVAIGATALIVISVAALAYSVHSNMTDPTASSYNAQSLNP